MSTCTQCLAEQDSQASFCSKCGAQLHEALESIVVTGTPPGSIPRETQLETYPAAPRVRRLFAAAIDIAIGSLFLIPLISLPIWMGAFVKGSFLTKILRFLPALYLLFRDSIGGRSIGKALMGLVTYDRSLRRPANVIDSVVRNWPLAFTLIPWIGWILSCVFTAIIAIQILIGRPRRLGDGFATTQVIDEKWLRAD